MRPHVLFLTQKKWEYNLATGVYKIQEWTQLETSCTKIDNHPSFLCLG